MKLKELFEEKSVKDLGDSVDRSGEHDFHCSYKGIESLEGAPSIVNGTVVCFDNKLKSLHNIHKIFKHISGGAEFRKNPIKSHILGLIMIDGLRYVTLDSWELQSIINKHLSGDRDVFACQEELIEAGFEEFAQL